VCRIWSGPEKRVRAHTGHLLDSAANMCPLILLTDCPNGHPCSVGEVSVGIGDRAWRAAHSCIPPGLRREDLRREDSESPDLVVLRAAQGFRCFSSGANGF
jgi:hypothetical protein